MMEMIGMTYVIAEPCIDVQDRACVSVCPVACIHFEQGKDRKLYIDPQECIDCGACEPVCPVEAISAEFDLPYKWRKYADIDALWYRDKAAARAMVEAMKAGS
jgi:NAD-dependent dihydropyrimidine dehydrogenase PreA subunit